MARDSEGCLENQPHSSNHSTASSKASSPSPRTTVFRTTPASAMPWGPVGLVLVSYSASKLLGCHGIIFPGGLWVSYVGCTLGPDNRKRSGLHGTYPPHFWLSIPFLRVRVVLYIPRRGTCDCWIHCLGPMLKKPFYNRPLT